MLDKEDIRTISISTGTMVRAILVLFSVFLLWFLRELVFVVLTSIVVASFMESSLPYYEKVKINRITGLVISYGVSIGILFGLFYLFAPLLITEIYNFSTFLSSYAPDFSILNFFKNEAFSGAKDVVSNLGGDLSLTSLLSISKSFIQNLSGGFFTTLSVAFGGIFNFVLIIILSFYLSVQERGIENFLRIIIPIRYEDYVVDLWNRSSKKIGFWVKGQMLLGSVVGILIYLILSLLGIDYALLLAIITGIMEMVPYGILVAMVPTFIFSYLSDGLGLAIMVTGAYVIVHQFEVFLFSPLIIKKIVGLSPIVVILSVLVGFELGGVWGAILAIPVSVILMEFLGDIEKHKVLSKVIDEKR
jgi:predicted PurR-regulated permease PerM